MQNDYHQKLAVKVPATRAFDGITEVSAWWVKDFEGSANGLNDTFTVRWGETFVTFRVSEYVPDAKTVWTVTDCNLPWLKDRTEWTGTKAVWELSAKEESTEIAFTHVGLTPDIECYEGCRKGWDQYALGSLPKLLLENAGCPA